MPLKVNNDYQDFDSIPEYQKQRDSLTMQSFYECQQPKLIELIDVTDSTGEMLQHQY